MKQPSLLWLLSIPVVIYSFEVLLAYKQQSLVKAHCTKFGITESRTVAAKRLGVGISVNGRWYRELHLQPPTNFPFGTHTSTYVIGFKEGDGTNWPVHLTDRFGFFNKDEWWNDKPTVLVMGDSFVTCEHLQSNSITGELRSRGVKAVNIGVTASGPVLQIGALKNYWKYVSNSVIHIVWCLYDGNDYQDACEEMQVPEYAQWLKRRTPSNPDPELLKLLPSNDQNLYGFWYAVRSVVSMKRIRLITQSKGNGAPIWNYAVADAGFFTNTKIVLVRIPKPGMKKQFDKPWSQIFTKHKLEPSFQNDDYSQGGLLSHLNQQGIKRLVDNLAIDSSPRR